MEQDGELSAYRQRLVDALLEHPERRRREEPGSLQVLVDQECVGALDCDGGNPTLISVRQPRPIRTVEIRTEAGLLVGGLCIQEVGVKVARFPVGAHALEVTVHNWPEGGAVKVAYRAATSLRRRVSSVVMAAKAGLARVGSRVRPDHGTLAGAPVPGASRPLHPGWLKTAVLAQGVLAVAVLFLAADRLGDSHRNEPTVARPAPTAEGPGSERAIPADALSRQEQMLVTLAQSQDAAMQTMKVQQRELARLHRAVNVVARAQQQLDVQLLTVGHRMRDLHDETRAEIEARNRELEHSVEQQVAALAKTIAPPEPAKPLVGKATEAIPPPPQVAEARRETPAQHVTFWVSFQDGTPEKSVDELIQEIRGRRGPINAGWHNVEVDLQQPQTPDGLFESLKKAKIVKAVATSLSATPGQ